MCVSIYIHICLCLCLLVSPNTSCRLKLMMLITARDLLFLVLKHYGICLAAIFSVGVTFLLSKTRKRAISQSSGIPGRLGLPFFGETLSFFSAINSTQGCYEFVRLRRLWHGKWFKTRLFGKIHVFTHSVEAAKTIFSNDFVLFKKGYVKSIADAVGEKSLLCVPQESHKRIKRLLSDPFSINSLSKFVQKLDCMLCQSLKKLESNKSFAMLDFSLKIIFDAMCEMLMSITDAKLLEQLERDITLVADAMLGFPVMIPGTRYYRGIKARKRLMETFETIIANRRSGKESPEDFLQSMLQRDSYPIGEKLDDQEIMDNLLTLVIAGQTTTAAALMWSVKFLDENTEVQDSLRDEQLSVLKSDGSLLTLEDLSNMPYASKVVKETLRMANVVLWFPRVALGDCSIEGFEIQKRWHVNIDVTYIHHDPALYKDPMQFNPSRFDEMQKPYSYLPFGSGPRTCLGMNMAKLAMLVFLHRLTSGYKWTVDDLDPCLEMKGHIAVLRSRCPITLTALGNGR